MKCPRCQQANPPQAKFCLDCGTPFTERDQSGRPAASYTDLQRALSEALDQQAATSEILRVISRSPIEIEPVFEVVVASAARLCEAHEVAMLLVDRNDLRLAAGVGPLYRSIPSDFRLRLTRGSAATRAVIDRATIHIRDFAAESEEEYPVGRELAQRFGHRTMLAVPLIREGVPIGVICAFRLEVRPFADQQIALLRTFADQAVIAIENVRLFNETKEALEQQMATSEILRVIGSSPTDAQPVFETIARSGVKVCAALGCVVFVVDGDVLRVAATHGVRPERLERFREQYPMPLTADVDTAQTTRERRVFHLADIEHNPGATARDVENARLAGYRTRLMVPMVRGDRAVGLIAVTRETSQPFPDQQVELLKTFADQAVIAIENVRLFKELEARNRELTDALDQQTATSEILRAISNSPRDVQPVFDAIAQSAARLCDAVDVSIFRVDGDRLAFVAHHGPIAQRHGEFSLPLVRGTVGGRSVLESRTVQVADLQNEDREFPDAVENARRFGFRTILSVPLLRDGIAIGGIQLRRTEVQLFSEPLIVLLQTFADQAVIAIENARLLGELQERTGALTRSVEQLTALGEVGRAVSSTLDLETVLTTIVSRAVELSGLDGGLVSEYDENVEEFVQRASAEIGEGLPQALREVRYRKGEGAIGRTAITREPVQVPDITIPGVYESRVRETLIESGVRAVLAVPMIHQNQLIGCLGVTRKQPGEFSAETIELLRTFATQSALAIQNARLFQEIANKSQQLEAASQHKSEFLANMSHELRTPLNAVIGFSEVLRERMFGDLNDKQEEYLNDIHASGQHLLSLINDILDLSKVEAGRMELDLSDFNLSATLDNALTLVRERAGRHGIALHMTVDEGVGHVRADERKIRQVVLNLLSNAIKFTPDGGQINVRAAPADGVMEVSVRDTGVGISPEDHDAIFEEFRQVGMAAKKVEGTGLGLALSRKFIELHGGRIWVESQVGVGSTFTFTIPVLHMG